jgi:hypothetical protein
MEEGFMLDIAGQGGIAAARWQQGTPEKSIWTGVKSDTKRQFSVCTYRCIGCGFMESYAT